MIVEANYRDLDNNMVTIPLLPAEIYRLAEKAEVMHALKIVDFLNFFEQMPNGVDIQRTGT